MFSNRSDRARYLSVVPSILVGVVALILLASQNLQAANGSGRDKPAPLPPGVVSVDVTVLRKVNTFQEIPKEARGNERAPEEVDRNVGFIEVDDARTPVYRFDSSAKIVDQHGREISMSALRLPCRARLFFYDNPHRAPYLYRVEVKGVLSGASAKWTPDYRDIRRDR